MPAPPVLPPPDIFYVVDKYTKDDKEDYAIYNVDESNVYIRCLRNDKLKPLLKYKKLRIYDKEGKEIYDGF